MQKRIRLCGLIVMCVVPQMLLAQNDGGNQGGGPGGGNGNGGVGGIRIDADGLVSRALMPRLNARELQQLLDAGARRNVPQAMNQKSELRQISLRDLDEEIGRRLEEGQSLPDEITSLAGLTRIDFVWIPEDGSDVVIAGPAEGFAAGPDGRVVGTDSHRPVLCLDDLLVALRSSVRQSTFGCSFDPVPQRLAQTQQLLRQSATATSAQAAQRGFEHIGSVLGNWDVRVFGVPENSHMSAAMVEADFVLKSLTTGDLDPGVSGFKSYLSLMSPSANSMQRWWFSPRYDAIECDSERRIFRFTGARLQVSAQDELVDSGGQRRDAASTHPSLEKYAQQFTRKLPALAEKIPAVAQLQNTFDLLVTAALMRQAQAEGRLRWAPNAMTDGARLVLREFGVPKETPSIVRVRMAGPRTVMGLIAGGVTMTPQKILMDVQVAESDLPLHPMIRPAEEQSWWWDAAL